MTRFFPRMAKRWLLGLVLLIGGSGCGGSKSYDQYIPSDSNARQALESALDSWRKGEKPGNLDGSPPIQVLDEKWKESQEGGQRLLKYEILKEESEEGPKIFSVRLFLENPGAEEVVRYFVLGKSPLMVFREEDYQKAIGG